MSDQPIYWKIRKVRELRGICQKYMAEQLNLCDKSYSRIENGITVLTYPRLEQIADILEVSVTDIINFDPNNLLDGSSKTRELLH
jgi:transcriptional regulator with XRE-family HTH domain